MNSLNSLNSLARSESIKRDRILGPEARWKLIQQAIACTDSLRPISRATPAACKMNEAKHLNH